MQTGLSIEFFAEAKKFEHEPVIKKIKFEHGAKVPCSNGIYRQLLCTKKAGEHSGFALEMLQQIRIEHRRQNARAQIYAQIYFFEFIRFGLQLFKEFYKLPTICIGVAAGDGERHKHFAAARCEFTAGGDCIFIIAHGHTENLLK